ncbi:MAG: 4Fe-4S dicluster domain-containing protein [Peptococcaceae bacterium]|nr:4Fe-4S dicluster domain-containing protein [Peptococcaceae bacterium]
MADCKISPDAQKYDLSFAREIYSLENGWQIKKCMQCGVCVVSCAAREEMEYAPRRLFNLIKAGRKEEVLKSNTMWMCTSCCTCKARCPRGIPIIDVMHDLKSYCISKGYVTYPQASFYQAFWQELKSRGRIFEGGVMARYLLRKGLGEAVKKALEMKDMGMTMLRHGRMPLMPPKKIKGMHSLQKIIEKAQAQQKEAK